MVKNRKSKVQLSNQLILNKFMLHLFEVDSFEDLVKDMKDSSLELLDTDNVSRFYKHLSLRLVDRSILNADILRQYDENIVSHTAKISNNREMQIRWKYFQYLSLLFTEIYMDYYFNQRNNLLKELNDFIDKFNNGKTKTEQIGYYDKWDLKKLAFWSATGSGKTLIMHINLLQYLHYFYRNNQNGSLDQIILLTPNESLSRQHLREFEASGMQASLFDKNIQGMFRGNEICIIDIHKLRETPGEKTIAIDAFEGKNLVLVDEGHKGSSGDEWRNKRERLSEDGFAFEYSATFGQAVSGKPELIEEYSKCVLFDYSYRYFYNDGYGKEYRILNLNDDSDDISRNLYLLACLTVFYQQMKLYNSNKFNYDRFLIEKPLWVFVGGSVNALRINKGRKVSDVTDILLFIARFIKEKQESIELLERLLSGRPGLLDDKGNEIFSNSFQYLIDEKLSSNEIYNDILLNVFNTNITDAILYVENLKGVEGEIALRIGQNDPFAVINVRDTNELSKLCATYSELVVIERDFSKSYFQDINTKHSSINLLIGSKKFIEGWSSWRVSTMGLMNLGRSEGSQIIQMFGRGVRLKGYDFSLKRSEFLQNELIEIPENLKYLETLNIFGVRADYMQKFREYLRDDGTSVDTKYEEIQLPIIKNYEKRKLKLKALRLRKGLNFKKDGPNPIFKVKNEPLPSNEKIIVNWYPKLQIHDSKSKKLSVRETVAIKPNKSTFTESHVSLLDIDYIYFEMQNFKKERGWFNLVLSKEELLNALLDNSWYEIEIPKEEFYFNSIDKIKRWEEMALVLLKRYCEKQFLIEKKNWEAPHMEYYDITEQDKNFFSEYKTYIDSKDTSMISKIKQLKDSLQSNKLENMEFGGFESFFFTPHLYHPLIKVDESGMKISPAPLNDGEYNFVKDLRSFYESNDDFFSNKELYLLRNQSIGRGIGFFESGGFYPDFIIWILYKGVQYITFADPKGIRNHSITDSKLQFYKFIDELDERMNDEEIKLNAFIISNTSHSDILDTGLKLSKEEMKQEHILFQNDDKETYIQEMINSILNN